MRIEWKAHAKQRSVERFGMLISPPERLIAQFAEQATNSTPFTVRCRGVTYVCSRENATTASILTVFSKDRK